MSDGRTQGVIERSRRPGEALQDGMVNGSPFSRRIFDLRSTASLLLTLVVLYLMCQKVLGLDWREAWASIQGTNVGLFALAFAIFYCSFLVRTYRWETLLANVGYNRAAVHRIPSSLGLTRIMYLAWFANCVTVARLGDAYRGYLLKKAAGVSFVVTLGTVLAERLLDMFVLVVMMGMGLLAVFYRSLPAEATQTLSVGIVLTAIGVLLLLSMRRFQRRVVRILPERLHAHYSRLEHGVIGSFRRIPLLVAYSALGWAIEGMALYLVAAALDAPVSVAGAFVIALAAALLTAIPITPAGLGFTEGGMVIMLQWLGLDTYTASAVTLLFRIINYWSIVVFGCVIYVLSRNRNRTTEERSMVHG